MTNPDFTRDTLAAFIAARYHISSEAGYGYLDEVAGPDSGAADNFSAAEAAELCDQIDRLIGPAPHAPYLGRIIADTRQIRELEREVEAAVTQRDTDIRAAFKAGIPGRTIAKAAGISPTRVYQIRDGRR